MRRANENLRHGASASEFHHFHALHRIGVDADFFKLSNASGFENLLGLNAVGSDGGGVYLDQLDGFL